MSSAKSGFRLLNGQFALAAQFHSGGMAEIYAARDLSTDTKVAVKILTSGHLDAGVLKESYDRELLALSQLKHPAIVKVIV